MAERTPPDSPHVRSGVSSFSHISSPQSYQFSRDGDASDEEGSSWSSDEVCNSVCLLQTTNQHAKMPLLWKGDIAARSCGDVICLVRKALGAFGGVVQDEAPHMEKARIGKL